MLATELLVDIIDRVSDGMTFKSLLLTCKMFYEHFYFGSSVYYVIDGTCASEKYWKLVERFSNHCESRLLKTGRVLEYDSKKVSENFIREHRRFDWSWYEISQRKDLSLEFIEEYSAILRIDVVSTYNRRLTVSFITRNIHMPWSWDNLTHNPVFTEGMIERSPHLPWSTAYCEHPNPNFSFKRIAKYRGFPPKTILSKYPQELDGRLAKLARRVHGIVFVSQLSSKSYITLDIIKDNPKFPWDAKSLLHNPNITDEIVKAHEFDMPRLYSQWLQDGCQPKDKSPNFRKLCKTSPLEAVPLISVRNYMYASKHLPISVILAHPNAEWHYDIILGRGEMDLDTAVAFCGHVRTLHSIISMCPMSLFTLCDNLQKYKKSILDNVNASWVLHVAIKNGAVKLIAPHMTRMRTAKFI